MFVALFKLGFVVANGLLVIFLMVENLIHVCFAACPSHDFFSYLLRRFVAFRCYLGKSFAMFCKV